MPLYFAYGSNMDRAGMAERCPKAQALGRANLRGYRWFINSDGYASLAVDPEATTPGVLWRISRADINALDRYEAVDEGLYRRLIVTVHTPAGPQKALTYIANSTLPGSPSQHYRRLVLAAARSWRLPRKHLAEMERLMPEKP